MGADRKSGCTFQFCIKIQLLALSETNTKRYIKINSASERKITEIRRPSPTRLFTETRELKNGVYKRDTTMKLKSPQKKKKKMKKKKKKWIKKIRVVVRVAIIKLQKKK